MNDIHVNEQRELFAILILFAKTSIITVFLYNAQFLVLE